MRFGIFLAPFHRVGENPTLALQRDLELIATLDGLGYDEAWVGEHHSGGWETIAAPELFMAAAAERTRHIRLGTGVTSLPYHHPFMVAQRMVMLDHLTRGRVMLGVGPGALVTDAMMLGIDPQTLRPRMAEALDVILRLLTSVEPLTYSGEWFSLREAVLQLRPYTRPHFPVAVASTASPAGMTLAGRHGLRVLQLGPAMGVRGAVDLKAQWAIGEAAAAAAGQTLRRDEWSLVIPMHLAETRREAFQSARHGAAAELLDYFGTVLGRPCPVEGPRERVIEQMADSGTWIVGTPDDCVAGIRRYQEATGGFGGVLLWAHEWAAPEATRRSYELPGALRDAPLPGLAAGGRGLRHLGGGARGGVPGPGPGGGGSGAPGRSPAVRPVPRLSWPRRGRAGVPVPSPRGQRRPRQPRKRQTEEEESLSFADDRGSVREERKPSSVRTARLRPSRGVHLPPSKPLVSRRTYPLPPSRAGRRDDSSLGGASRLDAVSAYRGPTWPPGGAPGGTAGAPAVGPPRSSRTGGRAPQSSSARGG